MNFNGYVEVRPFSKNCLSVSFLTQRMKKKIKNMFKTIETFLDKNISVFKNTFKTENKRNLKKCKLIKLRGFEP